MGGWGDGGMGGWGDGGMGGWVREKGGWKGIAVYTNSAHTI